jgi:hypothetical protein
MLDAEDIDGNRFIGCFDDAIVTNDAILLAADNHLASDKDEFFAGTVGNGQTIDFRTAAALHIGLHRLCATVDVTRATAGIKLCDFDFAGAQAFIKSDEFVGARRIIRHDGKHRQVIEADGRAESPAGMRSGIGCIDCYFAGCLSARGVTGLRRRAGWLEVSERETD